MALDADEQLRAARHLRALRLDLPEAFLLSGTAIDAALLVVTDAQETDVRELLPKLDTMRASMLGLDTRLKAKGVGKLQLNPKEWADRKEQYLYFAQQLGAIIGAVTFLTNYAIVSDPDRGWGGTSGGA